MMKKDWWMDESRTLNICSTFFFLQILISLSSLLFYITMIYININICISEMLPAYLFWSFLLADCTLVCLWHISSWCHCSDFMLDPEMQVKCCIYSEILSLWIIFHRKNGFFFYWNTQTLPCFCDIIQDFVFLVNFCCDSSFFYSIFSLT